MSFKIEFQSFAYFIDRTTFAITKKELSPCLTTPVEKSAEQLLAAKTTILAAKTTSSKNLTKLEKLVQTIESALEAQKAKEFWLFSSTAKLKELKAFHSELKERLVRQESRELAFVQTIIQDINTLSLDTLSSFSSLYYSADSKVIQHKEVAQAKMLCISKLLSELIRDETQSTSLIKQLLLLDHTLSWLLSVCDTPHQESFFQRLIQHTNTLLCDSTLMLPFEARLKGDLMIKLHNSMRTECPQVATAKIITSSFCFIELLDRPLKSCSLESLIRAVQTHVPLTAETICSLLFVFLKELKRLKLYPDTSKIVRFALEEFSKREPEYRWYDEFFRSLNDLPFINMVIEALEQASLSGITAKIVSRHVQIQRLKKVAKRLLKIDSLSLAYQIEGVIGDSFSLVSRMIKKVPPLLPLSVHHIAERGEAVLLFKSKPKDEYPILYVKSGFKKVTAGLLLPHDSKEAPKLVAQAVNLTYVDKKLATFESILEMRREVAIHQKFNGSPGIWPILSTCEYTKKITLSDKSQKEIPKLSCITPLGAYTLENWLKPDPPIMTAQALLMVMTDLIQGLFILHSAGYIHGDIKNSNILLTEEFRAGFIDFGFSFRPGIDPLTGLFDHGYYGSRYCTAPEMLKKSSSDVDLFKAELFALGVVLLSLFLRQDPDWCILIEKHIAYPFPEDAWQKIIKILEAKIEEPYTLLCKKKKRSLVDELQLFTYRLLRIKPEERVTTLQAKEEIAAIATKFIPAKNV